MTYYLPLFSFFYLLLACLASVTGEIFNSHSSFILRMSIPRLSLNTVEHIVSTTQKYGLKDSRGNLIMFIPFTKRFFHEYHMNVNKFLQFYNSRFLSGTKKILINTDCFQKLKRIVLQYLNVFKYLLVVFQIYAVQYMSC